MGSIRSSRNGRSGQARGDSAHGNGVVPTPLLQRSDEPPGKPSRAFVEKKFGLC